MDKCYCLHAAPSHPRNLTIVTSIQTTDPGDPYLNVMLQWIDQQLEAESESEMYLDQNYTVTISPPTANFETTFHTTNMSIELALLYDQDYNISVVASNCVGNSTPAEIHFRIINNCSLVRDGVLMNYCLPSDEINIATTTGEMMANKSTNDFSSDLGPQQHGLGMHVLVL